MARTLHEELASVDQLAFKAQVLNRFYTVVTRKLTRPMTAAAAESPVIIEDLQDGQHFADLRVGNPFTRPRPADA